MRLRGRGLFNFCRFEVSTLYRLTYISFGIWFRRFALFFLRFPGQPFWLRHWFCSMVRSYRFHVSINEGRGLCGVNCECSFRYFRLHYW